MDSILNIFFENPIIIGGIIYFLWRMFKPSSEETKSTPKRPVAPPATDTRTAQPNRDREATTVRSTERRTLTTTSEELEAPRKKVTLTQSNSVDTVDTASFDYDKEKLKLDDRKKKAEEALKKLNQLKANEATAATVKKHTSTRPLQKPTSAQLREGILWAEILGKPRAKKSMR